MEMPTIVYQENALYELTPRKEGRQDQGTVKHQGRSDIKVGSGDALRQKEGRQDLGGAERMVRTG